MTATLAKQATTFPKMPDIFPKRVERGNVVIEPFEFKKESNFHYMAALMAGDQWAYTQDGTYVRMLVKTEEGKWKVMMSDTLMERHTTRPLLNNAKGNVLIAGLGIGMALHPLLHHPAVTSVTVVELSADVIALVRPTLPETAVPLTIIEADIFWWRPRKGTTYDTIFFDIWPDRSLANLPEIAQLHQAFKRFKAKGGWMASWFQRELRNMRAQDNRDRNRSYWR